MAEKLPLPFSGMERGADVEKSCPSEEKRKRMGNKVCRKRKTRVERAEVDFFPQPSWYIVAFCCGSFTPQRTTLCFPSLNFSDVFFLEIKKTYSPIFFKKNGPVNAEFSRMTTSFFPKPKKRKHFPSLSSSVIPLSQMIPSSSSSMFAPLLLLLLSSEATFS